MEHMREISEFVHGGSSVEVGAIGMDSKSNGNASAEVAFWNAKERRWEQEMEYQRYLDDVWTTLVNAKERTVELEQARLTMQYHREVPGFQSWFDRFEIDTEYDYLWDSNEFSDSEMSISDMSGYTADEGRVRDMK